MINLNPLKKVTDYQSMLDRIFIFTLVSTVICIWCIRSYWPWLNELLVKYDFELPISTIKIPIPAATFLPAFVIAIIARSIKLHDRISDLFRIRYYFDTRKIITPIAKRVGVSAEQIPRLFVKRNHYMRKIFYEYASSTNPKIDTHNIIEALDNWSWFWCWIESWSIWFVTGLIIIFLGFISVGITMILGASLIVFVFTLFYWPQCVKYVNAQIEDIFDDPQREAEIKACLNALQH
jgi:hypothetical protein